MTNDVQEHDIAKIRELLTVAFTDKQLRRFCLDRPSFQPIVARFGPAHGLDDMVDEVIEYCDTHLIWDELLSAVKEENPRQYRRYAEYLGVSPPILRQQEKATYLADTMHAYAIHQQVQMRKSLDISPRPYKGLFHYELIDRDVFFGRERVVQRFVDRIRGQATAQRVIVLHGPSGAGKTSLIKAGVIPLILRNGDITLYTLPRLAASYANPAATICQRILDAAPADRARPDLSDLSLRDFLRLATDRLDGKLLVIFLDQFEDFFAHLAPDVRASFVNELAACHDDSFLPIKLVFSIRKDYFADLYELEDAIPSIFYNQFPLEPMTREQAAQAITSPVAPFRVSYSGGLVKDLVLDLECGGMELPQLQLVCTRLYESRQGDTITSAEYEALGRTEGILSDYLDRFLSQMGPFRAMAEDVLKSLVTIEGTKRILSEAELRDQVRGSDDALDKVLTRLIDGRLLQREEARGVVQYEIAHEYLAGPILETEPDRLLRELVTGNSVRKRLSALAKLAEHALRQLHNRIPPRVRSGIAFASPVLFVAMLLILGGIAMLRTRASWSHVPLPQGDYISAIGYPQAGVGHLFASGCNARMGCSLFHSEDDGDTWRLVAAGVSGTWIDHIAIDPFNPARMWFATQGDGIFASDDGGVTWQPSSVGLGSFVVGRIEADPNSAGLLYAETTAVGSIGGLYRSRDHGQSWHILNADLSGYSISDFTLTNKAFIFAAISGQGVYRCSLGAETECSRSVEGLDALDITQIRYSPVDDVLYAGSSSSGLFKSTDWGDNWHRLAVPQYSVRHVAVDSLGKLYVVTEGPGGCLLWFSGDQGDSWQMAGPGWLHSTVHSLSSLPGKNSTLFAGTPSGLLRSTDGGINWSYHSVGVRASAVQDVVLVGSPGGSIYVVTTAGTVFHSRDKGLSWELASHGLNAPAIRDLAMDPGNPTILYAGTYRPNLEQSLFVTWDAGNNWTELDVGNDDVRMIAVDPNEPQRLFVAAYGSGILSSEDGGLTWKGPLQPMIDPWTQAVAIAPQNSDVLVAGTSTGVLYQSVDGGRIWKVISTELPPIRALVISSQEENLVYAGTRRGVWIFNKQSGSWSWTNSLLDASIRALVRDPCTATGLFAGTAEGDVFRSTDGGQHWTGQGSEQVIETVSTLTTFSDCTHSIFVGTGSEGLLLLDYHRLWDHIWPFRSQ
jgi:photosystem II stability/assembly factor-like uncharacterized protein